MRLSVALATSAGGPDATLAYLAPLLGAIVGVFITVSDHSLGQLLAVYAGFFLYMGATDLLPQAHEHPSGKRVALTALGFAVTFLVARAAT